jgi:hypothetical protein
MFGFLRRGVKKDYEIDKRAIGQGQFAIVRRAVRRETGREYAIKTIYKENLKKNVVRNLFKNSANTKAIIFNLKSKPARNFGTSLVFVFRTRSGWG